MGRPGRAFNRQELLRAIWGDSAYRDPRAIDVHIRHLREKLEAGARAAVPDPHRARHRLPLPRGMRPRLRLSFGGLRGRLLLALVLTSMVTLAAAAAVVLGPLQQRLRDQSVESLRAAVLAARPRLRERAGPVSGFDRQFALNSEAFELSDQTAGRVLDHRPGPDAGARRDLTGLPRRLRERAAAASGVARRPRARCGCARPP